MEATYKWEIGKVEAKATFRDKHGNQRSNVIKKVELIHSGSYNGKQENVTHDVFFNITDLSNFLNAATLTKEQILTWALDSLKPKEKEHIEKTLKLKLGLNNSNSVTLDIL